jgi:hypothetical protein
MTSTDRPNKRRAIFAFCNEPGTSLFREIDCLFNLFSASHQREKNNFSSDLKRWVGDVLKFGIHISLRGVCQVNESRLGDWHKTIEGACAKSKVIEMNGSRLLELLPHRLALTFQGPREQFNQLNGLAYSLAQNVAPLIRWSRLSQEELDGAWHDIEASSRNQIEKQTYLELLSEIQAEVKSNKLPPLPSVAEYRLPLLLALWGDKKMKRVLLEVGDPYSRYLSPHISLFSAIPNPQNMLEVEEYLQKNHPHLFGQSVTIDRVYSMAEHPSTRIMVREYSPLSGSWQTVSRPAWHIEHSYSLGNGYN